ncbi:MAG: ABC transporter ATP-binding protein [Anaerofustis stercorihominis]|nr:ABC transporter ATP-binding protein [Anaerofustis stercorihominis]
MIKLKNVNFSYEGVSVLKNINYEFEKGRIYSVIGPNGSGKTTLLKLLGNLRECESGEVTLNGKNYSEYSRKEFAKNVASLPQSRNTPSIRARELVSHGRFPYLDISRKLSDEDKRIVEEALISSGAEEYSKKNLTELSGGERQKVYLAMLYAQMTDYVLLDEPTTYLDVVSQFVVMNSLKKMKGVGKCVIAVLHDISLAMKYSDELIVINHGRIAGSGNADEILDSGILKEVFGIDGKCVEVDGEKEYVFRPVTNEY